MRLGLLYLLALAAPAADWTLFTCMATTKNYVVGGKLLPSGVFYRSGPATWERVAHNHPFMFALDYDPADPSTLYVAAGNGLIRMKRGEAGWKILTGHDVTELRDVSIDPRGTIYFAHVAGIRRSDDRGISWREVGGGLLRKYTEAVRADRTRIGIVIAGTEDGLWRSPDAGSSWKRAGASGFQVMRLEQSPHDACFWLAGTQQGGLFASRDCGVTFENLGNVGVGRNIYDIAFDPAGKERIAVAGWGIGVVVSEDGGETWKPRHRSLPTSDIWSVAFDPSKPGRMFAAVHEDAMFVSEDGGVTWKRDGLEGTIVNRMKFVPDTQR